MVFAGFGPNLNLSHVDPDLVFALVSNRKTTELFAYLASIPGASEDVPCRLINLAVLALLDPSLRTCWPQQPDEQSWTLHLAEYSWIQATHSRLCVPQMVGDPFDFSSDTELGDAPMLNQLSVSSSRIRGETFTPQQPISNDVLRHSAMRNQSSAPGSRIAARTFPPQQTDLNAVLRDAPMLNQLSASSSRIPGATFAPPNSNDVLRHSAMLNQSSAPGSRIPAMTFPHQQTDSNAVLRDAPMLNQLSGSSSRIPGATFSPPNSNDVLSHSAMLNQSSPPGSRIPAMTFPHQQTDSNAGNNFPVRRARTFNQEAAFNPGAPASANDPRNNSTVAPAFAPLFLSKPGSGQMAPHKLMQDTVPPQELEQCNYGTPVTGVLLPHQLGPEKFTPQMLVQNREVLPSVNIEGTKPASEVYQLDPVILRLNVASFIPQDGTEGGAGVLIRNNNTAEFIGATNFRIQSTEPARIFAATCYEAIKIVETHQPITIILESHLFPLLDWFCTNQIPWPEIEELKALLKPPRCVVRNILEESNGAACHLAIHAMLTRAPRQLFTDPPCWLLPYLSGC